VRFIQKAVWSPKSHRVGELQNKALEILQNIPESKRGDYYSLANELELRNGTKHLTPVYQSQLKSRLQGPSETPQEFGTEVGRLTRLAYPQVPEECLNQIAMQTYSLEFKVARNLSHKKDSVQDDKFEENQYQSGKCYGVNCKEVRWTFSSY